MKLFVAGEVFDDPSKWSGLNERTFLLAEIEAEARDMIDGRGVVEVRMDKAVIL